MWRAFCIVVGLLTSLIIWWSFSGPNKSIELAVSRTYPKSCLDLPQNVKVSDVYQIQPEWPFQDPVLVHCDQEYESGGWTVIQRRIDGTLSFERPEMDYVNGFGNVDTEYWLGLEHIYRLLTSAPHELVILLEDFSGNHFYAKYGDVEMIKYESKVVPSYELRKCKSYTGNAGDFILKYRQSTYDERNGTKTVKYEPIDRSKSFEGYAKDPYYGGYWISSARCV
ncbi:AGAP004917-PA-like protein [Anopheles sinensis]|uniref:AGAP004917-PA-like protein n=1 Tax=Anopheles sinensis TaxID=74873 RepID=A0A084WCW7_ANOSI|nr:AGAP004917-PA-like protein [Anopheles sinensis]